MSDDIKEINKDFLSPVSVCIKKDTDNLIGYKSIEQAGIARFFQNILENSDKTMVFENTLASTLHGIDAITKDNNNYTIHEIKGTTCTLKSARSYLKKTKNKGRQLTLKWCWFSLTDFAEFPTTSNIFLELYEDFINQNIKRKLSIVECEKQDDNSYIGNRIHTFDFNSLDIIDDYDMSKQKKMLSLLKKGQN